MRLAWIPLLLACQPGADLPDPVFCPAVPIGAGEVWVGEVVCAAQRFGSTGDGRNGDLWLANSRIRVVLRHPNAALTLAGLGGGTVIDAAAWGQADLLHEASLLVDGGWLLVDEMELEPFGVRLAGTVRALPDRPIPGEGARREVRWILAPDDPWLRFEGASGLWIHPSDTMSVQDGWLVAGQAVIGHDGTLEEDLGGAVRIEGATGVLFADTSTAWALRGGPTQRVVGTAPGASTVRLFRGDAQVGVIPVADDAFDAIVPADVDGLQAFAGGRPPSPRVAPGDGVVLTPGPPGSIVLWVGWEGARPRPVAVAWSAGDGRAGEALLSPAGGVLALGSGVFELTVSAGPTVAPRSLRVEVGAAQDVSLGTTLVGRFDPDDHVLASLDWRGSHDRGVRESGSNRSRDAVAAGVSYAVVTARDVVDAPTAWLADAGWLQADGGAVLTSPAGWSVAAWPWNQATRLSGLGAPRVADLGPLDALALAWGGVGTARNLAVDLAWLAAVDAPPWQLSPRPTHVRLEHPGDVTLDRWRGWLAWLDARRFLLPSGPLHWLDVGDLDAWGPVEVGRAVHYGRYSTGTGAWVDLRVGEAGPGEVVAPAAAPEDTDAGDSDSDAGDTGPAVDADTDPPDPPAPLPQRARVELHPAGTGVRHLALIGPDGPVARWEVAGDLTAEVELVPPRWLLAVAWDDAGVDWAVTAPIFAALPADRPAP